MQNVRVRPATPGDLDEIVAVFLGCWRETYAAVLPQRTVDLMTDEKAHALWGRVVSESEPGDLLVAHAAAPEQLLGVARTAPVVAGTGHLASLYVRPQAQGMGVGRLLMDAALERLERSGARSATLWVFRDNAPSLAFYRHLGWEPDGEERTQPEFGEPELRLARTLGREGR
ncbi:N-acetyltransferase family protein [Actinotalea sp.]|uniref:GNAT family N-acetyltransferase n=1 Tax=Actinotalea sp. TaxID=1872145 RepID=UPI00356A5D17